MCIVNSYLRVGAHVIEETGHAALRLTEMMGLLQWLTDSLFHRHNALSVFGSWMRGTLNTDLENLLMVLRLRFR